MRHAIRKLGSAGIITEDDSSTSDLPPGVFTDSDNVDFYHGAVGKASGWVPTMADFSENMLWFQNWEDQTTVNIAFLSADKIWTTTNGTVVEQATILGDALAAATKWQSDVFGKFCVVNNSIGKPKYSSAYTSGTDTWTFSDLPDWANVNGPNNKPAQSVRGFRNHLVALGVDDSPYTVFVSDQGTPEAIPTSWDSGDPTKLARKFQLQSKDGKILDAGLLNDRLIIYQRYAATALEYVGGNFVMTTRRLFDTGLINRDAWTQFDNYHLVVSENSIVIHDGSVIQQPDHPRVRHRFFGELGSRDSVKVTRDPDHHMILIYYSTASSGPANRILSFNYLDNLWSFRSIGTTVQRIAPAVAPAQGLTWAQLTMPWSSLTQSWAELGATSRITRLFQLRSQAFDTLNSGFQKTLNDPVYLLIEGVSTDRFLLDGTTSDKWLLDSGGAEDYDAWAQRSYLDLDEITGNASTIKRVMSIYPQVRGSGKFDLQVGISNALTDPVRWSVKRTIDLSAEPRKQKVDVRMSGRYLHWRFGSWDGSKNTGSWSLSGMDIELAEEGTR